jgi:hypothetical protein
MPTKTLCDRCHTPLDESMNWCATCRTAPWAPASWERKSIDLLDWPDIWNGHAAPGVEPIQTISYEEAAQLAEMLAPRVTTVWSLRRALSTVALLVWLATMSAVFVPERVVGFISLLSLGTVALLVVRRAWVSQPVES